METQVKISADIIDYLGKYDNGVLVLLSINCDDNFTEGTIYYSKELLALTVDESVEIKIGNPIEIWDGYRNLVESILKKVVPYDEIINRIDEIDFTLYTSDVDSKEGEDVKDSEVKLEK